MEARIHGSRRPRYVVQELQGYEILSGGETGPERHTYYVVDLHDLAKVVYTIECEHDPDEPCLPARRRANRICYRLNTHYDHYGDAAAVPR